MSSSETGLLKGRSRGTCLQGTRGACPDSNCGRGGGRRFLRDQSPASQRSRISLDLPQRRSLLGPSAVWATETRMPVPVPSPQSISWEASLAQVSLTLGRAEAPLCGLGTLGRARQHPCGSQATPARSGDPRGAHPPLLLCSDPHPTPRTVIKITSFCYNLNIPTSHKGLYYTRVTPGPVFAQKSSRQVPPPDEVTY